MFQEVTAWTVLISTLYMGLPYCVPVFRNRLKQIHLASKCILGNTCINDEHQRQVDSIDRTVEQVVSTTCQLGCVVWAILNLVYLSSYESLNNYMIGLYIADTLYLFVKPFGKTQRMFVIHHGMTIVTILYIKMIPFAYHNILMIMYILLELSGASINTTNMLKYFYPLSKNAPVYSLINLIIYFSLRVCVFPISVVVFVRKICMSDIDFYVILQHFPPFLVAIFLYSVCVYWFIGMVGKHTSARRKLLG